MNNIEIITLNKPGINDYALARNDLLKKSKKEWVMFLDKDERILDLSVLDNKKLTVSKQYSCYIFLRKNFFLGQFVGTDKIIRLVKKGTGKWNRKVHETWVPMSGKVGTINTPLIHNTAVSITEYLNKINKYSTLHAIENNNEGKRSNIIKIIFYPPAKFLITLVKSRNIVFSIMQSLHSFLSWSKLYLLQNNNEKLI